MEDNKDIQVRPTKEKPWPLYDRQGRVVGRIIDLVKDKKDGKLRPLIEPTDPDLIRRLQRKARTSKPVRIGKQERMIKNDAKSKSMG